MSDSYAIEHYENFPVASLLLPQAMRRPISIVYRFARSADDFADEGDLPDQERLRLLAGYRAELDRLRDGQPPQHALFRDLGREVIDNYHVPIQLFYDLLDAFSQDVVKTRYADFAELRHYCMRSASPVGRIVLHIAGQASPANLLMSDDICIALQLINFWQDVAIDWQKARVYLPQEDLQRFGVTEAQIAAGDTSGGWWPLLQYQIQRSQDLLQSGAPLGSRLPGRLGVEIRLTVLGGASILSKLLAVRGDMFQKRPRLRKRDWPFLFARALFARPA